MPKSFSPPKYRHFKPRNLAVVRIHGRDHYLGPFGSPESLEQYARLIAEHGASSPASVNALVSEITITELACQFFRHAEMYYRRPDGTPTHEVNNIRQALRVLRELYGTLIANDFGPLKLQVVRQAMIDRGWSRGNINRAVRRVVLCFQWACQNELIKPDIFHGLKCVKGLQQGRSEAREADKVKPVPDAWVEAVIPLVRPQVAAMIRLNWNALVKSGFSDRNNTRMPGVGTRVRSIWVLKHKRSSSRFFTAPPATTCFRRRRPRRNGTQNDGPKGTPRNLNALRVNWLNSLR
jgi:hypothetical protein